jgi:predicted nuclease of predicted toxin-antitoxin system
MKFKLDENLPAEIVLHLQDGGHDAETVYDEALQGAPDRVILEQIKNEGRILLTMDKGIGDIRTYPPREYAGVVLFRPGTAGRSAVLEFVRGRLAEVLRLDLAGRLVVVTDRAVRIR